ncbi:MAG: hypothetical protein CMJ62_06820 [Planctomycetaceae bacterium]|nr:hypothetical protein [Planctomycetaceae bacterium]
MIGRVDGIGAATSAVPHDNVPACPENKVSSIYPQLALPTLVFQGPRSENAIVPHGRVFFCAVDLLPVQQAVSGNPRLQPECQHASGSGVLPVQLSAGQRA